MSSDKEEITLALIDIRDTLIEQGFGECRYCPFRAFGSPTEIMERLGQHGEEFHEGATDDHQQQ